MSTPTADQVRAAHNKWCVLFKCTCKKNKCPACHIRHRHTCYFRCNATIVTQDVLNVPRGYHHFVGNRTEVFFRDDETGSPWISIHLPYPIGSKVRPTCGECGDGTDGHFGPYNPCPSCSDLGDLVCVGVEVREVECNSCKGTGTIFVGTNGKDFNTITGEGALLDCPICHGEGKRWVCETKWMEEEQQNL